MSDYKKEAADRRDARQIKTDDEPTTNLKPSKKKKDTKRWCKGKVGVEHDAVCMTHSELNNVNQNTQGHHKFLSDFRYLVCLSCGKNLDMYLKSWNKKIPDWVDK